MKATELRIGNWYDHNGIYRQATWDTIHEVWEAQRSWCKPIRLTEEILLKCGFEFINNTFYRSRNSELCLYYTASKNKMIPDYYGKRLVTGYDFKYLHQLQNLYHALTGEELTVNL